MANNINYNRLLQLNNRIKSGQATKEEKSEYMLTLYNNGNITKKQYDEYKTGLMKDDLLNAAIIIGTTILVAYLLGQLVGDN